MSRRTDPAEWMWAQACDFIEQAERMHRQFFRLASSPRAQAVWEPPADVFENERSLLAAQLELLASHQQVLADTVTLYKALGGGWAPLEVANARN